MERIKVLPVGIALMTSLSLVGMSTGIAAYAQSSSQTISESQALSKAKAVLQVPALFTLSSESFSTDQNGNSTYNFSFSYTSPDNQDQWLNITVDASSGVITSYSRSSNADGFVYPLPVNATQAKSLAISWATKLYPQYVHQVQIQPLAPMNGALNQVVNYQYNFERIVNGIPAPFDGLTITIDQNGTLVNAGEHWTAGLFPKNQQTKTSVQADQLDQKYLNLYLTYWTSWNANGKSVPSLTYQQPVGTYAQWWNNQFGDPNLRISGIPVIDAQSGEPVNAAGKVQPLPAYTPVHPLVAGGGTKAPGAVTVNWNEQTALTNVQHALQIPSQAKLKNANQFQNIPDGNVDWDFTWTLPSGEQYSASVDATLGVLTNFDEWSNKVLPLATNVGQGHPHQLTQPQVTAAATAFVKRILPKDTGGIALIPSPYVTPQAKLATSFMIEPIVNGIPDVTDTGNINVDAKTGEVTSYYTNFSFNQAQFPPLSQAISLAKAKQDWTIGQPLQLVYLLTQPSYDKQTGIVPQGKVILAYAPSGNIINNGTVMDAATGQFVSVSGNPPAYTGKINDISGIPQANEIKLLVSHGLLTVDANGNVHPTQEMTREQFVKLVVDALGQVQPIPYNHQLGVYQNAMGMTSSASSGYSEVYSAFANGWLNNGQVFEPNQPITRGDAAQLLTRALGYGELLNHPEAFQMQASDASTISSDQLAGVAIASALGLLPLQSGSFNPAGRVTIADAAQAVVYMVSDYSRGQSIFSAGATSAGGTAGVSAGVANAGAVSN